MDHDDSESHPLDKNRPSPNNKPDIRLHRKEDAAHRTFLDSPAGVAAKPYLHQDTLDIVDGIRLPSVRARSVSFLPAIEESQYEDKEDQGPGESRSASYILPSRFYISGRVSSKPALTSISEERISRSVENTSYVPQGEAEGESSSSRRRGRAPGDDSKKCFSHGYGDVAVDVRERCEERLDPLGPDKLQELTPQGEVTLGKSPMPAPAGGEGLVPYDERACGAAVDGEDHVGHRLYEFDAQTRKVQGEDPREEMDYSNNADAPDPGGTSSDPPPPPAGLVGPITNSSIPEPDDGSIPGDEDMGLWSAEPSPHVGTTLSTSSDHQRETRGVVPEREQADSLAALQESSLLEDNCRLSGIVPVKVVDNINIPVREQTVPMGDTYSNLSERNSSTPSECYVGLDQYIQHIVISSVCDVMARLTIKDAQLVIQKSNDTSSRNGEHLKHSTAHNVARAKGSGSDSRLADATAGSGDMSAPRESHSEQTTAGGSASSEKQDKEFKDKETKKQRDKDHQGCKQRGRERERNKRKKERDDMAGSGGKRKWIRNALGDVKRSKNKSMEGERLGPLKDFGGSETAKTQPQGKSEPPSVQNKDESGLTLSSDDVIERILELKKTAETLERGTRNEDMGDVRERSVKSTCGLEHQTVTANNESTLLEELDESKDNLFDSVCREIEFWDEGERSDDENVVNVESSKTSTSRFGKRTVVHRQRQSSSDLSISLDVERAALSLTPGHHADQMELSEIIELSGEIFSENSCPNEYNFDNSESSISYGHSSGEGQIGDCLIAVSKEKPFFAAALRALMPIEVVYDESFNHPPKYVESNPSDLDNAHDSSDQGHTDRSVDDDNAALNSEDLGDDSHGKFVEDACDEGAVYDETLKAHHSFYAEKLTAGLEESADGSEYITANNFEGAGYDGLGSQNYANDLSEHGLANLTNEEDSFYDIHCQKEDMTEEAAAADFVWSEAGRGGAESIDVDITPATWLDDGVRSSPGVDDIYGAGRVVTVYQAGEEDEKGVGSPGGHNGSADVDNMKSNDVNNIASADVNGAVDTEVNSTTSRDVNSTINIYVNSTFDTDVNSTASVDVSTKVNIDVISTSIPGSRETPETRDTIANVNGARAANLHTNDDKLSDPDINTSEFIQDRRAAHTTLSPSVEIKDSEISKPTDGEQQVLTSLAGDCDVRHVTLQSDGAPCPVGTDNQPPHHPEDNGDSSVEAIVGAVNLVTAEDDQCEEAGAFIDDAEVSSGGIQNNTGVKVESSPGTAANTNDEENGETASPGGREKNLKAASGIVLTTFDNQENKTVNQVGHDRTEDSKHSDPRETIYRESSVDGVVDSGGVYQGDVIHLADVRHEADMDNIECCRHVGGYSYVVTGDVDVPVPNRLGEYDKIERLRDTSIDDVITQSFIPLANNDNSLKKTAEKEDNSSVESHNEQELVPGCQTELSCDLSSRELEALLEIGLTLTKSDVTEISLEKKSDEKMSDLARHFDHSSSVISKVNKDLTNTKDDDNPDDVHCQLKSSSDLTRETPPPAQGSLGESVEKEHNEVSGGFVGLLCDGKTESSIVCSDDGTAVVVGSCVDAAGDDNFIRGTSLANAVNDINDVYHSGTDGENFDSRDIGVDGRTRSMGRTDINTTVDVDGSNVDRYISVTPGDIGPRVTENRTYRGVEMTTVDVEEMVKEDGGAVSSAGQDYPGERLGDNRRYETSSHVRNYSTETNETNQDVHCRHFVEIVGSNVDESATDIDTLNIVENQMILDKQNEIYNDKHDVIVRKETHSSQDIYTEVSVERVSNDAEIFDGVKVGACGGVEIPADGGVEIPADDGVEIPADGGVEIPADGGVEIPADGGVEIPADDGVIPTGDGVETTVGGGMETPVAGGVETPAGGRVETPAGGRVETPAGGRVETHVSGGVETPAGGRVEIPVSGGVETHAVGGMETPAVGGVETPAVGGVETPAGCSVEIPVDDRQDNIVAESLPSDDAVEGVTNDDVVKLYVVEQVACKTVQNVDVVVWKVMDKTGDNLGAVVAGDDVYTENIVADVHLADDVRSEKNQQREKDGLNECAAHESPCHLTECPPREIEKINLLKVDQAVVVGVDQLEVNANVDSHVYVPNTDTLEESALGSSNVDRSPVIVVDTSLAHVTYTAPAYVVEAATLLNTSSAAVVESEVDIEICSEEVTALRSKGKLSSTDVDGITSSVDAVVVEVTRNNEMDRVKEYITGVGQAEVMDTAVIRVKDGTTGVEAADVAISMRDGGSEINVSDTAASRNDMKETIQGTTVEMEHTVTNAEKVAENRDKEMINKDSDVQDEDGDSDVETGVEARNIRPGATEDNGGQRCDDLYTLPTFKDSLDTPERTFGDKKETPIVDSAEHINDKSNLKEDRSTSRVELISSSPLCGDVIVDRGADVTAQSREISVLKKPSESGGVAEPVQPNLVVQPSNDSRITQMRAQVTQYAEQEVINEGSVAAGVTPRDHTIPDDVQVQSTVASGEVSGEDTPETGGTAGQTAQPDVVGDNKNLTGEKSVDVSVYTVLSSGESVRAPFEDKIDLNETDALVSCQKTKHDAIITGGGVETKEQGVTNCEKNFAELGKNRIFLDNKKIVDEIVHDGLMTSGDVVVTTEDETFENKAVLVEMKNGRIVSDDKNAGREDRQEGTVMCNDGKFQEEHDLSEIIPSYYYTTDKNITNESEERGDIVTEIDERSVAINTDVCLVKEEIDEHINKDEYEPCDNINEENVLTDESFTHKDDIFEEINTILGEIVTDIVTTNYMGGIGNGNVTDIEHVQEGIVQCDSQAISDSVTEKTLTELNENIVTGDEVSNEHRQVYGLVPQKCHSPGLTVTTNENTVDHSVTALTTEFKNVVDMVEAPSNVQGKCSPLYETGDVERRADDSPYDRVQSISNGPSTENAALVFDDKREVSLAVSEAKIDVRITAPGITDPAESNISEKPLLTAETNEDKFNMKENITYEENIFCKKHLKHSINFEKENNTVLLSEEKPVELAVLEVGVTNGEIISQTDRHAALNEGATREEILTEDDTIEEADILKEDMTQHDNMHRWVFSEELVNKEETRDKIKIEENATVGDVVNTENTTTKEVINEERNNFLEEFMPGVTSIPERCLTEDEARYQMETPMDTTDTEAIPVVIKVLLEVGPVEQGVRGDELRIAEDIDECGVTPNLCISQKETYLERETFSVRVDKSFTDETCSELKHHEESLDPGVVTLPKGASQTSNVSGVGGAPSEKSFTGVTGQVVITRRESVARDVVTVWSEGSLDAAFFEDGVANGNVRVVIQSEECIEPDDSIAPDDNIARDDTVGPDDFIEPNDSIEPDDIIALDDITSDILPNDTVEEDLALGVITFTKEIHQECDIAGGVVEKELDDSAFTRVIQKECDGEARGGMVVMETVNIEANGVKDGVNIEGSKESDFVTKPGHETCEQYVHEDTLSQGDVVPGDDDTQRNIQVYIQEEEVYGDVDIQGEETHVDVVIQEEEAHLNVDIQEEEAHLDVVIQEEEAHVDVVIQGEEAHVDVVIQGEEAHVDVVIQGEEAHGDVVIQGEEAHVDVVIQGEEAHVDVVIQGEEAHVDVVIQGEEAHVDVVIQGEEAHVDVVIQGEEAHGDVVIQGEDTLEDTVTEDDEDEGEITHGEDDLGAMLSQVRDALEDLLIKGEVILGNLMSLEEGEYVNIVIHDEIPVDVVTAEEKPCIDINTSVHKEMVTHDDMAMCTNGPKDVVADERDNILTNKDVCEKTAFCENVHNDVVTDETEGTDDTDVHYKEVNGEIVKKDKRKDSGTPADTVTSQAYAPANYVISQEEAPVDNVTSQTYVPAHTVTFQADAPADTVISQADALADTVTSKADVPANYVISQEEAPIDNVTSHADSPVDSVTSQTDASIETVPSQVECPIETVPSQVECPVDTDASRADFKECVPGDLETHIGNLGTDVITYDKVKSVELITSQDDDHINTVGCLNDVHIDMVTCQDDVHIDMATCPNGLAGDDVCIEMVTCQDDVHIDMVTCKDDVHIHMATCPNGLAGDDVCIEMVTCQDDVHIEMVTCQDDVHINMVTCQDDISVDVTTCQDVVHIDMITCQDDVGIGNVTCQDDVRIGTVTCQDDVRIDMVTCQDDVIIGNVTCQDDVRIDMVTCQDDVGIGNVTCQDDVRIGTVTCQDDVRIDMVTYQDDVDIGTVTCQDDVDICTVTCQTDIHINMASCQDDVHINIVTCQDDTHVDMVAYQKNVRVSLLTPSKDSENNSEKFEFTPGEDLKFNSTEFTADEVLTDEPSKDTNLTDSTAICGLIIPKVFVTNTESDQEEILNKDECNTDELTRTTVRLPEEIIKCETDVAIDAVTDDEMIRRTDDTNGRVDQTLGESYFQDIGQKDYAGDNWASGSEMMDLTGRNITFSQIHDQEDTFSKFSDFFVPQQPASGQLCSDASSIEREQDNTGQLYNEASPAERKQDANEHLYNEATLSEVSQKDADELRRKQFPVETYPDLAGLVDCSESNEDDVSQQYTDGGSTEVVQDDGEAVTDEPSQENIEQLCSEVNRDVDFLYSELDAIGCTSDLLGVYSKVTLSPHTHCPVELAVNNSHLQAHAVETVSSEDAPGATSVTERRDIGAEQSSVGAADYGNVFDASVNEMKEVNIQEPKLSASVEETAGKCLQTSEIHEDVRRFDLETGIEVSEQCVKLTEAVNLSDKRVELTEVIEISEQSVNLKEMITVSDKVSNDEKDKGDSPPLSVVERRDNVSHVTHTRIISTPTRNISICESINLQKNKIEINEKVEIQSVKNVSACYVSSNQAGTPLEQNVVNNQDHLVDNTAVIEQSDVYDPNHVVASDLIDHSDIYDPDHLIDNTAVIEPDDCYDPDQIINDSPTQNIDKTHICHEVGDNRQDYVPVIKESVSLSPQQLFPSEPLSKLTNSDQQYCDYGTLRKHEEPLNLPEILREARALAEQYKPAVCPVPYNADPTLHFQGNSSQHFVGGNMSTTEDKGGDPDVCVEIVETQEGIKTEVETNLCSSETSSRLDVRENEDQSDRSSSDMEHQHLLNNFDSDQEDFDADSAGDFYFAARTEDRGSGGLQIAVNFGEIMSFEQIYDEAQPQDEIRSFEQIYDEAQPQDEIRSFEQIYGEVQPQDEIRLFEQIYGEVQPQDEIRSFEQIYDEAQPQDEIRSFEQIYGEVQPQDEIRSFELIYGEAQPKDEIRSFEQIYGEAQPKDEIRSFEQIYGEVQPQDEIRSFEQIYGEAQPQDEIRSFEQIYGEVQPQDEIRSFELIYGEAQPQDEIRSFELIYEAQPQDEIGSFEQIYGEVQPQDEIGSFEQIYDKAEPQDEIGSFQDETKLFEQFQKVQPANLLTSFDQAIENAAQFNETSLNDNKNDVISQSKEFMVWGPCPVKSFEQKYNVTESCDKLQVSEHIDANIKNQDYDNNEAKPYEQSYDKIKPRYNEIDEMNPFEQSINEINPQYSVKDVVNYHERSNHEINQQYTELDGINPYEQSFDDIKPQNNDIDETNPFQQSFDDTEQHYDNEKNNPFEQSYDEIRLLDQVYDKVKPLSQECTEVLTLRQRKEESISPDRELDGIKPHGELFTQPGETFDVIPQLDEVRNEIKPLDDEFDMIPQLDEVHNEIKPLDETFDMIPQLDEVHNEIKPLDETFDVIPQLDEVHNEIKPLDETFDVIPQLDEVHNEIKPLNETFDVIPQLDEVHNEIKPLDETFDMTPQLDEVHNEIKPLNETFDVILQLDEVHNEIKPLDEIFDVIPQLDEVHNEIKPLDETFDMIPQLDEVHNEIKPLDETFDMIPQLDEVHNEIKPLDETFDMIPQLDEVHNEIKPLDETFDMTPQLDEVHNEIKPLNETFDVTLQLDEVHNEIKPLDEIFDVIPQLDEVHNEIKPLDETFDMTPQLDEVHNEIKPLDETFDMIPQLDEVHNEIKPLNETFDVTLQLDEVHNEIKPLDEIFDVIPQLDEVHNEIKPLDETFDMIPQLDEVHNEIKPLDETFDMIPQLDEVHNEIKPLNETFDVTLQLDEVHNEIKPLDEIFDVIPQLDEVHNEIKPLDETFDMIPQLDEAFDEIKTRDQEYNHLSETFYEIKLLDRGQYEVQSEENPMTEVDETESVDVFCKQHGKMFEDTELKQMGVVCGEIIQNDDVCCKIKPKDVMNDEIIPHDVSYDERKSPDEMNDETKPYDEVNNEIKPFDEVHDEIKLLDKEQDEIKPLDEVHDEIKALDEVYDEIKPLDVVHDEIKSLDVVVHDKIKPIDHVHDAIKLHDDVQVEIKPKIKLSDQHIESYDEIKGFYEKHDDVCNQLYEIRAQDVVCNLPSETYDEIKQQDVVCNLPSETYDEIKQHDVVCNLPAETYDEIKQQDVVCNLPSETYDEIKQQDVVCNLPAETYDEIRQQDVVCNLPSETYDEIRQQDVVCNLPSETYDEIKQQDVVCNLPSETYDEIKQQDVVCNLPSETYDEIKQQDVVCNLPSETSDEIKQQDVVCNLHSETYNEIRAQDEVCHEVKSFEDVNNEIRQPHEMHNDFFPGVYSQTLDLTSDKIKRPDDMHFETSPLNNVRDEIKPADVSTHEICQPEMVSDGIKTCDESYHEIENVDDKMDTPNVWSVACIVQDKTEPRNEECSDGEPMNEINLSGDKQSRVVPLDGVFDTVKPADHLYNETHPVDDKNKNVDEVDDNAKREHLNFHQKLVGGEVQELILSDTIPPESLNKKCNGIEVGESVKSTHETSDENVMVSEEIPIVQPLNAMVRVEGVEGKDSSEFGDLVDQLGADKQRSCGDDGELMTEFRVKFDGGATSVERTDPEVTTLMDREYHSAPNRVLQIDVPVRDAESDHVRGNVVAGAERWQLQDKRVAQDRHPDQASKDETSLQIVDMVNTDDNLDSLDQWSSHEALAKDSALDIGMNLPVEQSDDESIQLQPMEVKPCLANKNTEDSHQDKMYGLGEVISEEEDRVNRCGELILSSIYRSLSEEEREDDFKLASIVSSQEEIYIPKETSQTDDTAVEDKVIPDVLQGEGLQTWPVMENNFEGAFSVPLSPSLRLKSSDIGDGKFAEKREEESAPLDESEKLERLLTVAAENEKGAAFESSPLKLGAEKDEESLPLVKETKDGRRRVKKSKQQAMSLMDVCSDSTVVGRTSRSAPQKTKSTDECALLNALDDDADESEESRANSLRATRSSPTPKTAVKRIQIVDVEDFPIDVPCVYYPDKVCTTMPKKEKTPATQKVSSIRTPTKHSAPRPHKKTSLWKRLKAILKAPRLTRRDGKFRFVKKYKKDANLGQTDLPSSCTRTSVSECDMERCEGVSGQTTAKLGQHETRDQDSWSTWHNSPAKTGALKHKAKSRRNEWRQFRRLRLLRHSAEMMGPTLPPIRVQTVSSRNYVRMYSEDYQRSQDSKLVSSGADDRPRRRRRKKRRSKSRSSKQAQSPLLEHPKENLATKRCELANSAAPEVFEIFCDDDEESREIKEEPTVRMLMKPLEVNASDSVASDPTCDPLDLRAKESVPCTHLREMGQVHQGLSKGSASFWRLRCVVM